MTPTVEFLFDVGSPYSYLAYHRLPRIAQAHGAQIVWTPVLLGGIFQATGNASPAEVPAKSLHSQVDLQRWARAYGVPFRMNPYFPINTLALMRGAVAAQMQDAEVLERYLRAIFAAMFEQPRDLGQPAEIGAALARAGLDPVQFQQQIADPAVKGQLKQTTARAVERGVFGAPTFFVGEEMFWGQDRLEFVAQALAGQGLLAKQE